MPSEGGLPVGGPGERVRRCPSLLVTSVPGRDAWAAEEVMDTVFSADPGAVVERSRYRGVFLVYSSQDPARLASRFLAFTHAFVARVVPVLWCGALSELREASALVAGRGGVSLEVRAREPLKRDLTEAYVRSALGVRVDRGQEIVIVVENIDELVLVSVGRPRQCGPRCVTLVP